MKAKKKAPKKPPSKPRTKVETSPQPSLLKGWQQIAAFLSQPISVAQRWAKGGMPVVRQGRYTTATPGELNKWLGREAGGDPVRVTTADTDLAAELKRGLAFVRAEKKNSDRRGQKQ